MALTNQEILDAIAEKTVMEIVDLIAAMEEKFGVSAAALAAPAAAGGDAPAAGRQPLSAGRGSLSLVVVRRFRHFGPGIGRHLPFPGLRAGGTALFHAHDVQRTHF